jgi:hypothetical protein
LLGPLGHCFDRDFKCHRRIASASGLGNRVFPLLQEPNSMASVRPCAYAAVSIRVRQITEGLPSGQGGGQRNAWVTPCPPSKCFREEAEACCGLTARIPNREGGKPLKNTIKQDVWENLWSLFLFPSVGLIHLERTPPYGSVGMCCMSDETGSHRGRDHLIVLDFDMIQCVSITCFFLNLFTQSGLHQPLSGGNVHLINALVVLISSECVWHCIFC